MLPPTRSPGMSNHPVSPSVLGGSARDNYTTSTPGLHRHPHTLSPRSDLSRYSTLPPETPRSVLPTTMPLSNTPGYGAGPVLAYGAQPQQSESPPFGAQETFHEMTCEGTTVTPSIEAKVDKGFFYSPDRVWTCYRRNYFAVSVSFTLTPWVQNGRLYINRGGKTEQVQSLAVFLAAAVDGNQGKPIELIQHTPKRDKGPQLQMKKELLSPTPPGKAHEHSGYSLSSFHHTALPGPSLPLQNEAEAAHQYSPTSHANSNFQHNFERIQFKCATANNGKRRAQQQYYHLIVELWANVQNPRDEEPIWVKIAARSSQPVVVRGRSPSHYSGEGPHNASNARGGGGSNIGGPGYPGLGANGSGYGPPYKNGLSGGGNSAMGGGMYRGNTYSLDPSPVASHVGSHSVSSASSLSGGPVDGLVGDHHMHEEEDTKMMESQQSYQYYPSTIYENTPMKMDTTGLPLPERRIKEEYPGPAALASGWSVGSCGRFQGMETSRGYYPPDVHAHVGY
ncbi:p53-like transcription factor [Aaosphaeria arxii CBS 175.79]|uniref:p53-like transcription factor n=1 Tax=Aaosphaeria arxii CBS 175.79 TaxID=1450172 RepID=A0A6A5XJV3_9PLEO|nr:p53-like transcription factor [Aaosphaeria arxii CBS 175.79]KAF2013020.1 p53-like transcription factor [Aaosphaeria arxii CBS 175.79]